MAEIKKTKKDAFLERMRSRHADKNFEDEEELYGAMGEDYDNYEGQLDGYRQNEEQLVGLFNKDPRSASFLLNWKDGKDPLMAFIEEYGEDAIAALQDPEKREEYTQANAKYLEKIAANTKLQEEASANLEASLLALEEAQGELGMTPEQANQAFELFDKVQDDAIVNKVDKQTWVMFLKGLNFDEAVADAEMTGEVRGKNTKIDQNKKMKTPAQELPPVMGGQGKEKKASTPDLGALGRIGGESIWEKGKRKY